MAQVGEAKSQKFEKWEIPNQEFRANLQWAVIVAGERETSPGVLELLAEIAARGVEIQRYLAQDT